MGVGLAWALELAVALKSIVEEFIIIIARINSKGKGVGLNFNKFPVDKI